MLDDGIIQQLLAGAGGGGGVAMAFWFVVRKLARDAADEKDKAVLATVARERITRDDAFGIAKEVFERESKASAQEIKSLAEIVKANAVQYADTLKALNDLRVDVAVLLERTDPDNPHNRRPGGPRD